MQPITTAFQHFYNYLISIAGIIALAALIVGGILYLTSAGKPEQIDRAKKQILGAFLGIIILFSSYLILRTINPELVKLNLPQLQQVVFSPLQVKPPETKVPELLGRVQEIAKQLKEKVIPGIKNSIQNIKNLTDKCDCENTHSLCYCAGGSSDSPCQARYCYAGPGFQPCPDETEIKENQKNIIAWKDEILYYKNRALAETDDLKDETTKVLDEKIRYYTEVKATETDARAIKDFEDRIIKLEKEKSLKETLGAKLKELADLIGKISDPASELGQLPDKCLSNVEHLDDKGNPDICKPGCKSGAKCHDYKEGCQPDKCSGGNPCPTSDIQDNLKNIQNLNPQITSVCDEILDIIKEIINLKTITI